MTTDPGPNSGSPPPTLTAGFDVVLEFLASFCADRERGAVRPLREYLDLFPGNEEIIAREFVRLTEGTGKGVAPTLSTFGGTVILEHATRGDRLPVGAERYQPIGLESADDRLEIHRARDLALDREVTVLVLVSRDASVKRRFRRWLVAGGARLQHPNIVPVHDTGVDAQGRSFCVLDPLEGERLDAYLARSEETAFAKLSVLRQVALTIDYAHTERSVHGALSDDAVRVGDFGAVMIGRWYRARLAGSAIRRRDDVRTLGDLLQWFLDRGGDTSALDPEVPTALARLIGRCHGSAGLRASVVASEIQEILDGAQDRRRRREGARRALAEAEEHERQRDAWKTVAREKMEAATLCEPEPWSPPAKKKRYWTAVTDSERALRRAERRRDESVLALEAAHRWDPGDRRLRDRLIESYRRLLTEAEEASAESLVEFAGWRLRSFGDPELDRWVSGHGEISVRCKPVAELVTVRAISDRDRRWMPRGRRRPLEGPRHRLSEAPIGSYEITVEREGYRTVRAPALVRRGQCFRAQWTLRREAEFAPGFCWVPSGVAIIGGDRSTHDALPRRLVDLPDFAISEFPITCEEYGEYLSSLVGSRSLESRLPRGDADSLEGFRQQGGRIEVLAKRRRTPVVGITWHAATAYAEWRSERDGRKYRLPSDLEWEKAARGVDGRWYPWGNAFDASFCHCASSRRGEPGIEPIGRFRLDCSPYGVRDLGGGVMDWCRSWFSKKGEQRLIRGGAWRRAPIASRCAYRAGAPPGHRYPFVGFRLVQHFQSPS